MWPFRRASPRPKDKDRLGRLGEALAVGCLRGKGYRILARNFRCPSGEIDIIALDRCAGGPECQTIAFVEVKARSSDRYVDPESAVDFRKQRQLARAARSYLSRHAAEDYLVRFDVISVVIGEAGGREVRHITDAFKPT